MQKDEFRDSEKVLSLALDLGKNMVKCGAEINRVEETVVRICFAYGMRSVDVFSIIKRKKRRVSRLSASFYRLINRTSGGRSRRYLHRCPE